MLKATSHLISYSQGMNYIGAIFLLEVVRLPPCHNPTVSQPQDNPCSAPSLNKLASD